LVLDICNLTLDLINKLSISSIWPLIWSILVPLFMRLFQFAPWFWISSIKPLIDHQTSISIQLSPWFDQINSQNCTLTLEP
jgi:hypothetical protein